ncbi:NCS2 family permease [Lysinibacillus fusiformis]|nr:NCS2 family permease [Lysinibacillus fusiformis]
MFRLKENNTTVKTEIFAGLTTFFTMVYVVIVNPSILSIAGVPSEQVFTATIIAAVFGTLWLALFANYPIAMAPGMGLNAFFTFTVVQASKGEIDYMTAFSAVFVAGIIFFIISLTPLRQMLVKAIPNNLKLAITAGIGLFIAFIGMRSAGLVTGDESNLVKLGDLSSPMVWLTIVGVLVTAILMMYRVFGAIFWGMIVTAIIAAFTGNLTFNGVVAMPALPEGILVWNPIEALGDVIQYGLYGTVFSFILVTLFDTTGTMVGVAKQAGILKDDKLPRARQAFLGDSLATTIGSMFGTSPTTAYVESSSGVAMGGRTGLTSLTVAVLFLITAFFSPLAGALANVSAITSPALIIVGSLMIGAVRGIEWDKVEEAIPAFLVILIMPLTSSISTGIAFGFISYPLFKLLKGEGKDVHPLLYFFAILFIIQLVFMPH